MENLNECKGCLRSVNVSQSDIQKMIDEIKSSGNFSIVGNEEYNERLEQCHNCKYMEYGSTCSQCGCIVHVRALLKDKDCPHPSVSRWK